MMQINSKYYINVIINQYAMFKMLLSFNLTVNPNKKAAIVFFFKFFYTFINYKYLPKCFFFIILLELMYALIIYTRK